MLNDYWGSNLGYGYPFADVDNLSRVTQFEMFPKKLICDTIRAVVPPNFLVTDEFYTALADLDLPLYITTNYDNLMFNALKNRKKAPEIEIFRWNHYLDKILKLKEIKPTLGSSYEPSVDTPLVYHLHGHIELPESIILTESDYLDFMFSLLDTDHTRLPPEIVTSLTSNSIIFLGYSLNDWRFRFMLRSLFRLRFSTLRYQVLVHPPLEGMQSKNRDIYLQFHFYLHCERYQWCSLMGL